MEGLIIILSIIVIALAMLFGNSSSSDKKPTPSKTRYRTGPPTGKCRDKSHLNIRLPSEDDSKRRNDLTEPELLALQETMEKYVSERFIRHMSSGGRNPKIDEHYLINHISLSENVSKRLVKKALDRMVVDASLWSRGSYNKRHFAYFVRQDMFVSDSYHPDNREIIPGHKFKEKFGR